MKDISLDWDWLYSILATACISLKIIRQTPSIRQYLCARARDLSGYQCNVPDYRDTRGFIMDHTNNVLQTHSFELSQLRDESVQMLFILDSHVDAVREILTFDRPREMVWSSGNGGVIYDLRKEYPPIGQCHAVALNLMRDVHLLVAHLQLDLSFFEGASKIMGLFGTSSHRHTSSALDILRTLIIRCHAVGKSLV